MTTEDEFFSELHEHTDYRLSSHLSDEERRYCAQAINLALIPALRGGFRARNARRRAYYRRSFVPKP